MAASYPTIDPRRARALLAYLNRIAPGLAPQWAGPHRGQAFGRALFEIAARLGEETTSRLDQTPERDALAFLDELDIASAAPYSAEATLAFALSDNRDAAVALPERAQVSLDRDGTEVIFETLAEVDLAPGRLADLIALDPITDRIERAPARVFSLDPPGPEVSEYVVATFSGNGSTTLQVNPARGLDEGDLIRVGGLAYRIESAEGGLLGLADPLEAPATAQAPVTKITSLESFDLRNLQAHAFYLGHSELFNLEQRSKITLMLSPPGLAQRLGRANVSYSLWGTKEGRDDPDWHELGHLGVSGPRLRLAKSWLGPVEETEVEGKKSRWLRAKLEDNIESRANLRLPVSGIDICVQSPKEDEESDDEQEGSKTVAQAFHNNTPLSTAGRFYPFGPEPQRFDTFAIAAPEALSKKGSRVELDIRMNDASLTSFAVALRGADQWTAYSIGENGYLEALGFADDGGLRWQELDPPDTEDASSRLDGERGFHVGLVRVVRLFAASATHVIVAQDNSGRLWSGSIKNVHLLSDSLRPPKWTQLPKLADEKLDCSNVAIAHVKSPTTSATDVLLFAFANGRLRVLSFDGQGTPSEEWGQVAEDGTDGPQAEDGEGMVVEIRGPAWPEAAETLNLVLLAESGAVWLGSVDSASSPMTVSWARLNESVDHLAAFDVRPVATSFVDGDGNDGLWVAWAERVESHRMRGWRRLDGDVQAFDPPAVGEGKVVSGTALHAIPQLLDVGDDHPVTVGLGEARIAIVWGRDDHLRTTNLPDGVSTLHATLFVRSGQPPQLLLGGERETLISGSIDSFVTRTELHDGLTLIGDDPAHYLRLSRLGGDALIVDVEGENEIVEDDTRVYRIGTSVELGVGETYKFLRRVVPGTDYFEGTVGDDRSCLKLDDEDVSTSATSPGHILIIEGSTYMVGDVEDGEAELDGAIPEGDDDGGIIRYTPTRQLSTESDTVGASDLGTLVGLPDELAGLHSSELAFGNDADPAVQPVAFTDWGLIKGVWARLGEAWVKRPPDVSTGALVGDLAVTAWTIHDRGQDYQNPELSWEFFDGDGWRPLEERFLDQTQNLATSGVVAFDVPPSIETTDIGGKDDYWIRARLIGGDYGRARYIIETSGPTGSPPTSTQTVTVDTSNLRPPEIAAIEASFRMKDPVAPEILLVRNNLATLDQTQAAAVDQAAFELFEGALTVNDGRPGRALYLGFTKQTNVNPLALFADVEDQAGEGQTQADVLTADGWRQVAVEDETESLRRRGVIRLFINLTPVTGRLFGADRFWIRLSPEADDAAGSWAPVVHGLYPNAAAARQAKTIDQEILGSSLGEPGMSVQLSETPVLPDSLELRVRERLSDEETEGLEEEQRRLRRLSGNTNGQLEVVAEYEFAPGSWVLWRRVDSFVGHDGDARVYLLDPSSGRVTFGDGSRGKIPPAGRDAVRAFAYQKTEGELGNVDAWTDLKLKSTVEAVDSVILPVASAGGLNQPGSTQQIEAANDRLRHAGQFLTPADVEALAAGASPNIVRARCIRPDAAGDPIRLVISRRNGSRCPEPSLAERDAIARRVQRHGWGGLADQLIEVLGPTYVRLRVTATIVADAEVIAEVDDAVERSLLSFLHPATGGPNGAGWPFGRRVWESDLLRVLGGVEGVDRVEELSVESLTTGIPLEHLPEDGLICVERNDIDVRVVPKEAR